MHTGTWLALAAVLAAPLAVAGQPQSASDHRDTPPSAPANRTQSPIGRALAGLLQQVPAPRSTPSTHTGTAMDAPRDATVDVRREDGTSKDAPADQIEVAVH